MRSSLVLELVLGYERVKQREEIPPYWRALQRPCKHWVEPELQSHTVPARRRFKMYRVEMERVVFFLPVLKLTASETFWMGNDGCVWGREHWAELRCSVWTAGSAGERCTRSVNIFPPHLHLFRTVCPIKTRHTLRHLDVVAVGISGSFSLFSFFYTEWKNRQCATVFFLCFGPWSLCCFL